MLILVLESSDECTGRCSGHQCSTFTLYRYRWRASSASCQLWPQLSLIPWWSSSLWTSGTGLLTSKVKHPHYQSYLFSCLSQNKCTWLDLVMSYCFCLCVLAYTPCLKKTVPTYFLILVCQIWTDFNNKKALLRPRAARDSAPWWIVIQYLQRLKMVYFS